MKFLQKGLSACVALILSWSLLILPAAASTYMEHDGLEITVEMDKEQYEDGEPITATIVVENTGFETVTITNLEQLIPEGYVLSEDSEASIGEVELMPYEIAVLEVTFEKAAMEAESAVPEDFFGKLLFGETWGLPNVLLLTVLTIAVIVFMLLT